jgi:hypothetical protein
MTGCTFPFNIRHSVSTTRGRTPLSPFAKALARNSIIARVSSSLSDSPTPLACERTRFTCSCRTWAGEMRMDASFPKPVFIPYAVVPEARRRSTAAREAFILSKDAGASAVFSPPRATA